MKVLTDGMDALGLEYSEEQIRLLEQYMGEIELWNPRYGLVNASGEDLVIKHILDSLAGVKAIESRKVEKIADVGSGAGLPGIPLAIMMPELSVSLIERSGKRVRFLRNAVAVLNLKNVAILEMDLKNVKEKYDLLTFRAFKPVEPVIIGLLMNILKDTGVLAAYKGKRENVDEEIAQVRELAAAQEILELQVPGLREERHLVFYGKK